MFNISKKNIIIFIIIFFIFSIVFIFWNSFFKKNKINFNSYEYEKIIKKTNKKIPEDLDKIKNFIIKNNNVYGILSAMFLAKTYVLSNDLDQAFIQLSNGLKYAKEDNLKNILKLRMARIKIQKNENKEAMEILNSIKNDNWNNIIENMKGDIFIKQNNKKEAIKSWRKSQSIEESDASKEIINMKILELKKE